LSLINKTPLRGLDDSQRGAAQRGAAACKSEREREREERVRVGEGEGSACRFIEGEGKGRGRRGERWSTASITIDGVD
jgi:hypothetical protein